MNCPFSSGDDPGPEQRPQCNGILCSALLHATAQHPAQLIQLPRGWSCGCDVSFFTVVVTQPGHPCPQLEGAADGKGQVEKGGTSIPLPQQSS